MSRLKTTASQAKKSVEQHISHIMDGYDGYQFHKDIVNIFDSINLVIENAIQSLQTSCSVTIPVHRKKMMVVYQKAISDELTSGGYQVQNMTVTYSAPNTTPVVPHQMKKLYKAPEATISFTIDWS